MLFVFCAEMGDKTQFAALAFSTRYKALTVLGAIFASTLCMHLISALIGAAAGHLFPLFWINLSAGLSFLCFGIWTIRSSDDVDKATTIFKGMAPFLALALTFFLSEIGDRTMLATITIASQQTNWTAVWLGSTLGMLVADALAIMLGKIIGQRLPVSVIRYSAASMFILCGICTLSRLFVFRA